MTETKSESFHRLAARRVENVEDALRILSNLSGPSYEWARDEVEAYFARVDTARAAAFERFTETKRWGPQAAEPEPEPAAIPDMAPAAPTSSITLRQAEMLRVWDDAANQEGGLVEMLAMQREMIAHLQQQIDSLKEA